MFGHFSRSADYLIYKHKGLTADEKSDEFDHARNLLDKYEKLKSAFLMQKMIKQNLSQI